MTPINSSPPSGGTGETQAGAADVHTLKPPERWDSRAAQLEELVARLSDGQQEVFSELYNETSPRVYGIALRVLRAPQLAAEVTQEVYVEIWRKAARYDSERGSVLAWITTMAHSRAVDRVRAASSESVRDETWASLDNEPEFDQVWDDVASRMDAERVRGALGSLTDNQREAITLAYFDGYSQTQVARLLNLPLGTVKTRIRAGLTGLWDALRMWV